MSNRNATATWSGFSHQGQVGLLVALREIVKLVEDGKENELDKHFLEYEKTEDCAIYRQDEDNAREYISIHQVKAYYSEGHLLNTYKSVFQGAEIFQKDEDGKYVKVNGNKVSTGNFEPGQWNAAPCENKLHTTMEIGNWSNEMVDQWSPNYTIRKYSYTDDKDYCGTDEIDGFLKQELLAHIFCNNQEGRANTAIKRLTYELDRKIRYEHATKQGKTHYDICFSLLQIRDFAISQVDFEAQFIYSLRKSFYNKYEEVVISRDISEEHQEKLDLFIDSLYRIPDKEFIHFVKILNLHVNPSNINDPHHWFDPTGMKYVFFRILADVTGVNPDYIDGSVQYLKGGELQKFLLTSIHDENDDAKITAENIIKNLNNMNVLWDNLAIINRHIDDKLQDLNPAFSSIEFENYERSDKFFEFTAKSRLISRDNAINVLNNEEVD